VCRNVSGNKLLSLKGCTKTIGGRLNFNEVDPTLFKDLRGLNVDSVWFLHKPMQRYYSLEEFDKNAFKDYGITSHPTIENNSYVDRVQDMINYEIEKIENEKEREEQERDKKYDADGMNFDRDEMELQSLDDDEDPFWDEDSEEIKVQSFKKFFMK
jgi:hypothetical protein